MSKASIFIATALLATPVTSGCSTATSTSENTAPLTATSITAPAVPAAKAAQAAAESIKAAIPEITALIPLTATNDTNNLIGRPNGYSAATVIVDSRTSEACSTAKPGVDCGATIEQWPDSAAAKKRVDYVEKMRGDMPALGEEYYTVNGGLLLRVAGTLEPSVADAYRAAFLG